MSCLLTHQISNVKTLPFILYPVQLNRHDWVTWDTGTALGQEHWIIHPGKKLCTISRAAWLPPIVYANMILFLFCLTLSVHAEWIDGKLEMNLILAVENLKPQQNGIYTAQDEYTRSKLSGYSVCVLHSAWGCLHTDRPALLMIQSPLFKHFTVALFLDVWCILRSELTYIKSREGYRKAAGGSD